MEARNEHECDLEAICDFRHNWTLMKEAEKPLPNSMRQWGDQKTEGAHFCCEEHEGEGVTK